MVISCRVPANFVQKRYSLVCITISITDMPGVVKGEEKGRCGVMRPSMPCTQFIITLPAVKSKDPLINGCLFKILLNY